MTTPELIAALLLDRERDLHEAHLARVAECTRSCCAPTALDRLARFFRRGDVACSTEAC